MSKKSSKGAKAAIRKEAKAEHESAATESAERSPSGGMPMGNPMDVQNHPLRNMGSNPTQNYWRDAPPAVQQGGDY